MALTLDQGPSSTDALDALFRTALSDGVGRAEPRLSARQLIRRLQLQIRDVPSNLSQDFAGAVLPSVSSLGGPAKVPESHS